MSNERSFLGEVQKMIREIKDPRELQKQLEEMVREEFPAPEPIFRDGEVLMMWQLIQRFRAHVCDGNETLFAQWKVEVFVRSTGELALGLGTSAAGKLAKPESGNVENGKPNR